MCHAIGREPAADQGTAATAATSATATATAMIVSGGSSRARRGVIGRFWIGRSSVHIGRQRRSSGSSASTAIAAFRPFTPITLPPGCVAAPQR
ncbi:MAG: hypothetical protein JWR81_1754 [Pseudonocardia sp.]|nr:hypothetical protein [Pseudonocardia sp.]